MKTDYVQVMRFLGDYASKNLNGGYWATPAHKPLFDDLEATFNDQMDKLGALRVKADLNADELDAIELMMDIENEFEVEISDEWWGNQGDDPTLDALAQHVVSLLK